MPKPKLDITQVDRAALKASLKAFLKGAGGLKDEADVASALLTMLETPRCAIVVRSDFPGATVVTAHIPHSAKTKPSRS